MTERQRTYTWLDPALVAAKVGKVSGPEYLQAVVRGEIRAQIQDTLDFSLDHVEEGVSGWPKHACSTRTAASARTASRRA